MSSSVFSKEKRRRTKRRNSLREDEPTTDKPPDRQDTSTSPLLSELMLQLNFFTAFKAANWVLENVLEVNYGVMMRFTIDIFEI